MIGNTLIDNSDNLKLVDTLNELINIPEIKEICIATGYWDLKGTALITDSLLKFLSRDGTSLRLLIGKDPRVFITDLSSDLYKSAKIYPQDYIRIGLNDIELNDEQCQKAVKMLMDYCSGDNPKIKVNIYDLDEKDERQFFHSKCYIFTDGTDDNSIGIVGSSNFTQKGLEGNSELNYLEPTGMIVNHKSEGNKKGHIQWFNEKWALSKDWTKEFVVEVQNSPVGKAAKNNSKPAPTASEFVILSPKESYYKLLINEFNSSLEYDGKIKVDDFVPADPNFMRFNYQIQAVNQAFGILEKHNGMILADVVGLGKTFTALMIAKRHLIETGFSRRVLIITPPAIKRSWEDSIEYFDRDAEKTISSHIVLTTIGTLDTDSDNASADANDNESYSELEDFDDNFNNIDYGMVIVDESHRFRNNKTIAYLKLENLLFETKAYAVLLSATPQNNRPEDILNQLYLFEHNHSASTIEGPGKNLQSYFAEKEKVYEECIKDWSSKDSDGRKIPKSQEQKKQDMEKLKEIADQIRDDVLNQLVIRRTRTDLQSDLYKEDREKMKSDFPKINPPKGIPYEMTGSLAKLFSHTLDVIAPKVAHVDFDDNGVQEFDFRDENEYLHYYRYRAIEYLNPKYQKLYVYDSKRKRNAGGTITAEGISERLAGLMELHLVKRLESSRDAFEESLQNLYRNTQNMIKMFEKGRIFICPDFDIHKIINSYDEAEIEKAFDQIKAKAENYNKKHQTQKNAEYKAGDFKAGYIDNLKNDARLIGSLVEEWAKNKNDKKRDAFVAKIESQFLNKDKNPNQKMVVFTECIATQNMLYDYLNDEYPGQVLKITADNRKDEQETLNANFDANYKGTPQDKYKILVTTDVLSEGVNLHRANTLVNYDSPWNSTRLMQRLGRINRIGSRSSEIFSYNFYPSTQGDSQINLYKRTLVKLQAFHNMFGEDSQIYTTDEEMVEIERPDFEVNEKLDPKIEFITELRDFKEKNPEEYARLCAVDKRKTIATAIINKTNPICHYMINNIPCIIKDDGIKILNQIEFCRAVKSFAIGQEFNLSESEYADFKHKCILAYQTYKSNEAVNTKPDVKKDEKEIVKALGKLNQLKKQHNLKDSKLLSDIIISVRENTKPLIRRILAEDCDNLLEIDSTLQDWHDLLMNKSPDSKAGKKEIHVQFEIIEVGENA